MENDVFVPFLLLLLTSACSVTQGQGTAGDVIWVEVYGLHVLRALVSCWMRSYKKCLYRLRKSMILLKWLLKSTRIFSGIVY